MMMTQILVFFNPFYQVIYQKGPFFADLMCGQTLFYDLVNRLVAAPRYSRASANVHWMGSVRLEESCWSWVLLILEKSASPGEV